MNDDPKLTYSDHSGHYVVDGERLEVSIYKLDGDAGWTLEVVNSNGTSIVWDDPFLEDQLALREFADTVEREGLKAFLDDDDVRGLVH